MGVVRVLLAIAVVLVHAPGYAHAFGIVPGNVAVEGFYLISGFYMGLVLDTKYPSTLKGTLRFYSNRYFRLAPTYWLVVALTVLAVVLGARIPRLATLVATFEGLTLPGKVFMSLTDLLIFGQDAVMFLQIEPLSGQLVFAHDLRSQIAPAYRAVPLPQAWSLGVELLFYVVAPVVLRLRTRWVIALALGSVALRVTLARYGFSRDPWTYRFFPSELALFLTGTLAYRWYAGSPALLRRKAYQWLSFGIAVGASLAFSHLPILLGVKTVLFYATLAVAVPGMFELTRRSSIDRTIGEWSYPIYVGHILFMGLIDGGRYPILRQHVVLCSIVVTVLFAAGVSRFIERPLDAIRQRRTRADETGLDARAGALSPPVAHPA